MNFLIKSALIVDPASPNHNKVKDIFIENGIITSIIDRYKSDVSKNTIVIEHENLKVSPGWFDMRVNFADPGFEQKETLLSGCESAIYGGMTGVGLIPDTEPPVSSKSIVEYILSKTNELLPDIYPYATVSKMQNGDELSEMMDLKTAGVIAFTDGNIPIRNTGLLLHALLYTKSFNSPLISFADDPSISKDGQINEGITSIQTGLKSIPSISEELLVDRDLSVCEYCESAIHFTKISSALAAEKIAEAKSAKMPVTADVTVNHLMFDEEDILDYNTNMKFMPPLRSKADKEKLIKYVLKGVIDVVVSDHTPHETELKKCEFEMAAPGSIGVQTFFPALLKTLGIKHLETIIKLISINPRKILGLPAVTIKKGEKANLTIFNTEKEWIFDQSINKSKSVNSYFWGKKLKGKPLAVVNGNKFRILD